MNGRDAVWVCLFITLFGITILAWIYSIFCFWDVYGECHFAASVVLVLLALASTSYCFISFCRCRSRRPPSHQLTLT